MDAHHATHDRQTHRQTERVRDEERGREEGLDVEGVYVEKEEDVL